MQIQFLSFSSVFSYVLIFQFFFCIGGPNSIMMTMSGQNNVSCSAKLEGEMENHQKKLQSELSGMRGKHEKDRCNAAKKRLILIEKIQRDDETEEKVFEKWLDQKAEAERREVDEQQKAEMKQQKHRWNTGANLPGVSKEQQKMQLARAHADQKQKLEVEQRQSHEMELRKYKRKRLTGRLHY